MNRTQMAKTVVVLGILLTTVSMAARHLEMIDSKPAAEAIVPIAPDTLQLWFSQEIEPGINRIGLEGLSGEVGLGTTQPAPGDETSMLVPIAETLGDGVYTVSWRAAGDDGHPVRGRFMFTVASGR